MKNEIVGEWEDSISVTNHYLEDSIILVNEGISFFEMTSDERLEKYLKELSSKYDFSDRNIEDLELQVLKNSIPSKERELYDFYIINSSGIIIDTTYSPDLGFDLSIRPDFLNNITNTHLDDILRSDQVVISNNEVDISKKNAYLPTSDHQYLLKSSINLNVSPEQRIYLYNLIIQKTISRNKNIISITLLDTLLRKQNEMGNTEDNIINTQLLKEVFSHKNSITLIDDSNYTRTDYFYIDTLDEKNIPENLLNLVAVIQYDTKSFCYKENTLFVNFLYLLVLGLIIGFILSYFISNRLTRPIEKIIDDIDQIAKGDLDHPIKTTGSYEFKKLEQSINLMVSRMIHLFSSLRDKENLLVTKEKRYREVVEQQSDLICRMNGSGIITYANDPFVKIFGLETDQVIGSSIREFIPDTEENKGGWRRLINKDPHAELSLQQKITYNGMDLWIGWLGTSNKNTSDEVSFQIIGRDISTQKEVEDALRVSEIKYRNLVKSLPDYVVVHHNGVILYVNPSLCTGLGYLEENLIGKSIYDFVHPQDIENLQKAYTWRLKGENLDIYEIQVRAQGGMYRSVLVRATPVPYDGIVAILGVLTDISPLKEAEKNIQDLEVRYQDLIGQLNEGIIVLDQKGNITYVNQRICDLLGSSRHELIDTSISSLIDPSMSKAMDVHLRKRKAGYSERYQMVLIHKSGKKVYVEISASPRYDSYRTFLGSLSVVTDITYRRESEQKIDQYTKELEKKNQELEILRDQMIAVNKDLDRIVKGRTSQVLKLLKQKDEFIMQLGHDLRTPLTPIFGLLPFLKETIDNDEKLEILNLIERNIRFIQKIAEKSLKLAKINSFEVTPEKDIVLISEAISDVLGIHSEEIEKKNIQVIRDIPDGLTITADHILFREIIDNLVGNALKFVPKNTGVVTLSARAEEDQIQFIISDNGIGINPDEREKIFDEFYKSDKSRHDRSSTGLGLSICKRIVMKHGGTIEVISEGEGKGTTFIVSLPNTGRSDISSPPIN